jgi:hypothetical protein
MMLQGKSYGPTHPSSNELRGSNERRATRLTFGLVSFAVIGWLAYVFSRPTAEMLAYLFDDAFYYLVPAHSFAHGEGWSFDGITRTSGFQVLYGYLAAAVARLTGLTPALPAVMAVVSASALLAGVWVLLVRIGRLYGATIAASAALLLLASPYVFRQITGGLEWSWLVLATALFAGALIEERPRAWLLAIAAFVAVLVRIDLAIFVALFTLALTGRNVRHVAVVAGGAAAAIVLTGLNSWLITGTWIPNSVSTKQFWSSTTEFLPAVSWPRLMRGTGPGLVLTELRSLLSLRSFVVLGAFAAGTIVLCIWERRNDWRRTGLAVAAAAAIGAYTLAYARGADIMGDHYAGAIAIPVFVLTCALLSAAGRYNGAVAAAIGLSAITFSIRGPWNAPGHLGIALAAPSLITSVPSGQRVAAWNAGLAGWQSGKRVTNLDGLANAEVVHPMRTGTLACYLRDSGITHIMDYGFMFAGQIDTGFSADEESRRRMLMRRNGYDPAALYRCTTLTGSVRDPEIPSQYRLFALDPTCLAAVCDASRRTRIDP